jgi:hypothetical protein
MSNKYMEKPSTPSAIENTNQNYIETPFYSSENGYQENKQHMLARILVKRNPYTLLVRV